MKTSKVMFVFVLVMVMLLAITALTCICPVVFAQKTTRLFPKRAMKSWEEVAAERRAQYAANPTRFIAPPLKVTEGTIISTNEADPIEGLIVNWWSNVFNGPDEADRLWMKAIGMAVKSGAEAYVYLHPWPYLLPETTQTICSIMLQEQEGIDPLDPKVHWYVDFATDSFWIRDYGPFFVREIENPDNLSIEDAKYYPNQPNDDALPKDLAAKIDVPVSDFDLNFTGGNFLSNGGGLCIVSSTVLENNPHLDRETIEEMFCEQLGCQELVIVDALKDAATGHVDMWLAWADHTTLLVGEYKLRQDPVNRQIIEQNVRKKLWGLHDPATGKPIKIVRMPMPTNCPLCSEEALCDTHSPHAPQHCPDIPAEGRIWRSYLNVLLINGTVLLPVYAQDRIYEKKAIRTWEEIGFKVVPLEADLIAPYGGEFHCVAKTF